MSDPLMEEIWRVREELLVEHGGMEGLLKHVKRLNGNASAKQQRRKVAAPKPQWR